MNKKKCHACGKYIDIDEEKYVLLGTYNGTGKSKNHEAFFHFQCWLDHFNQKIMDRIALGQDQAMKMLGKTLKNLPLNLKVQQNG